MRNAQAEARDKLGRPNKYGDEETTAVGVRIPQTIRAHLEAMTGEKPSSAIYKVLLFEKDLTDLLQPVLHDLRMSALQLGQEYGPTRAETLARLVKTGLAAEKKQKRAVRG